jgi:hypothetical protein
LARSPATNFLAARIGTFASFIALCENQASHAALQRLSMRSHGITAEGIGSTPESGLARSRKQVSGQPHGPFDAAGLT